MRQSGGLMRNAPAGVAGTVSRREERSRRPERICLAGANSCAEESARLINSSFQGNGDVCNGHEDLAFPNGPPNADLCLLGFR